MHLNMGGYFVVSVTSQSPLPQIPGKEHAAENNYQMSKYEDTARDEGELELRHIYTSCHEKCRVKY